MDITRNANIWPQGWGPHCSVVVLQDRHNLGPQTFLDQSCLKNLTYLLLLCERQIKINTLWLCLNYTSFFHNLACVFFRGQSFLSRAIILFPSIRLRFHAFVPIHPPFIYIPIQNSCHFTQRTSTLTNDGLVKLGPTFPLRTSMKARCN